MRLCRKHLPPRPEVVELRVHGVHGTSPADMLGVDPSAVAQVAGDRLTGIYRATAPLPVRDFTDPLDPTTTLPVSVEAYSWGALTSGVQGLLGWVKRALWLLLLPFALVNLASWARLHLSGEAAESRRRDRHGARAVRLAGLVLTVLLVLTPCIVAVDMVAWQCYRGGVPGCPGLPGPVDVIASWTAGRRMALGCAVPLAVIAGLWLLSRATLCRYEEVGTSPPLTTGGSSGSGSLRVLRSPTLWRGRARTLRLQRLHLAAGLFTVTGVVSAHVTAGYWAQPRAWWFGPLTAQALAGVMAVGAELMTRHPDDPGSTDADPPTRGRRSRDRAAAHRRDLLARRSTLVLGWAAIGTVVLLALLTVPSVEPTGQTDFWGHNVGYAVLIALVTACHLYLFLVERAPGRARLVLGVYLTGVAAVVAAAATHRYTAPWALRLSVLVLVGVAVLVLWHRGLAREHARQAWSGAAPSLLLAAAVWVALLYSSAAVIATATWLNGSGHGVADLVSASSRVDLPTPVASPQLAFVASGAVTVTGAFVVRDGTGVTVSGGTVEVETLGLRPDLRPATTRVLGRDIASPSVADGTSAGLRSGRFRVPRLPVGRPVPVQGPVPLLVPSSSVALEDSCLVSSPPTSEAACTDATTGYVARGRVVTGSQRLTLGSGGTPTTDLVGTQLPAQPLVVPQVLVWTTLAQLVWLALTLVVVAAAVAVYGRTAGRRIVEGVQSLSRAGSDVVLPRVEEADVLAVQKSRRRAGLAHRAEALMSTVGPASGLLGLLIPVLAASGYAPWEMFPGLRWLATLSLYVAVGVSSALVLLASWIRRSAGTRRAVGILWDLTTFWPRVAHPLAPPCYAERVVPELVERVRWVLSSRSPSPAGNQVILSGHSQGSTVLVAVLAQLEAEQLAQVRLVTYGSQLRAWYGRVFPAVFGPDHLGVTPTPGPVGLKDAFPDVSDEKWRPVPQAGMEAPLSALLRTAHPGESTWVSLFRRTDPIGFRVFSDADPPGGDPVTGAYDVVVAEVPPPGVGDPGPRVLGHGDYQHSLEYRRVVAAWTGERVVEPPRGTRDVPPLPGV